MALLACLHLPTFRPILAGTVVLGLTTTVVLPGRLQGEEPGPSDQKTQELPPVKKKDRTPALLKALVEGPSFKLRVQAAVHLGLGQDERAFGGLLTALGKDPHYTVRAAAAVALAHLGDPKAIPQLISTVALDPDPFVREEATRALFSFERNEALAYVVAAYNSSSDPGTRKQAVLYLAEAPVPSAEPVLERALGDTPEILEAAKHALTKMAPPEAVRFLAGALESRETSIRRGAVQVLETFSSAEATKLILSVYERDIEVDEVRQAARDALRKLRHFLPMNEVVRDATSARDKHARVKAIKLIGVVGGSEAREVLLTALSDQDIYVRGNAVMALRDLGDPQAVAPLERLANDPANQRIVHLVRHTLKYLRRRGESGDRRR